MFQIKPSRSNRTVISWKINPNRYASVLIITKPISIGGNKFEKKNESIEPYTPYITK